MTNSRRSVEGAFSLEPQHAQRLHQACRDLDDWPRSWHVEPADILVGQQIVQVLSPFLLHLLDQGLAKATFRRHRDNHVYLEADLELKRRVLAKTAQPGSKPSIYRPDDALLAFLKNL